MVFCELPFRLRFLSSSLLDFRLEPAQEIGTVATTVYKPIAGGLATATAHVPSAGARPDPVSLAEINRAKATPTVALVAYLFAAVPGLIEIFSASTLPNATGGAPSSPFHPSPHPPLQQVSLQRVLLVSTDLGCAVAGYRAIGPLQIAFVSLFPVLTSA